MDSVHTQAISAAAAAIRDADYLMIGAGAGASADSNLMVFNQVSAQPQLTSRNLTYDQVACLDRMCKDPALFYGFWLSSIAAYSAAEPHKGRQLTKIDHRLHRFGGLYF